MKLHLTATRSHLPSCHTRSHSFTCHSP